MSEWGKKPKLYATHLKYNNIDRLKEKGRKNLNHANTEQTKAGCGSTNPRKKQASEQRKLPGMNRLCCTIIKGGTAPETCRHFTTEHQNS